MNTKAWERSSRRIANLVAQPRAGWFRVIRNAADDSAPTRVDIYDEIGGSWFFGGVSAIDFVAELAAIEGDIEVHINSPGGDVFDGLAIYNSLAQRAGKVTTVVDGLAASAASFIAMAGSVRTVAPGGMMMIHDASGMCMGNAADMRELGDLLDKVSDNLAGIYESHTGRPGWRDAMKTETWYTADEAVAAGLAHRVAERPEAQALAAAAKFDLSVFAHAPDWLRNADAPAGPTHGAFTGTHTHGHAANGAQGDDDTHEHEHTHDGDGDHGHTHATTARAKAAPVLGLESMPLVAKALPVHHTAVDHSKWNGPEAVAAMPNDDEVLEYCHAWQSDEAADTPHKDGDDDADDLKSNYKFPHHRTKGGPANLNACRNGLARLEGSKIPEGDKAGVRAHLQAHLDDAKPEGDKDDAGDGGTKDHAGLPAWLNNDSAPPPAWLRSPAEEATK